MQHMHAGSYTRTRTAGHTGKTYLTLRLASALEHALKAHLAFRESTLLSLLLFSLGIRRRAWTGFPRSE